jgi:hypothetical protein
MATSQLDLLNQRLRDLESRVLYLEGIIKALVQFFLFIDRRGHAPTQVMDRIRDQREQEEGQAPPSPAPTTPAPAGPSDPSKPATPAASSTPTITVLAPTAGVSSTASSKKDKGT